MKKILMILSLVCSTQSLLLADETEIVTTTITYTDGTSKIIDSESDVDINNDEINCIETKTTVAHDTGTTIKSIMKTKTGESTVINEFNLNGILIGRTVEHLFENGD